MHFDFHARDTDNMDIFLGYPWRKSVATININIENIFLKLWYKKNKVPLHDISLTTQQETKGVHDAMSTWILEVMLIDTLDDESHCT